MHVPAALVWAALAFFADFIPRIGGYVMALPPVILALTIEPDDRVWVALFYLVSNEIIGDVVAPKIRGATMQMHPVLILFFTLAFALAFGLLGAIVAVPAAAFFSAFYSEFYLKRPLRRARFLTCGPARPSGAAGRERGLGAELRRRLLPRAQAEAIGAELSGSAALRTVRTLSQYHRMRGSEGFRAAAETIRDRLREAGLTGSRSSRCPTDGHIFYGTQRSRPGWNARFAELWEGGSGSPPGPTSRSASPRTASPAAPTPTWSTSAPGTAREPTIRARTCAAGSSSPPRSRARSRSLRSAASAPPASSPGRRTSAPAGGARTRA